MEGWPRACRLINATPALGDLRILVSNYDHYLGLFRLTVPSRNTDAEASLDYRSTTEPETVVSIVGILDADACPDAIA